MFYKYFNIRMCTKMIKVTNKYNANYFYKKGYLREIKRINIFLLC